MDGHHPLITDLDVIQTFRNLYLQVIREAADKPREITHKGAADLVTDTDQRSEKVVLGVSLGTGLCQSISLALL